MPYKVSQRDVHAICILKSLVYKSSEVALVYLSMSDTEAIAGGVQALRFNLAHSEAARAATDEDTRNGGDHEEESDGLVRTLVGGLLNRDGKGADRLTSTLASRFKKKDKPDKSPGKAKSAIRDTLRFARVRLLFFMLPVQAPFQTSCLIA